MRDFRGISSKKGKTDFRKSFSEKVVFARFSFEISLTGRDTDPILSGEHSEIGC